ncbi:MAG: hypothetical protein GF346_08115, partial [Candidatus Eisenbacteria bacterium]|nr:hypothetical protein [Candidatus Latescibacterota bacterium]MBD3302398.1 hypothetical protein [Candidatus Eisenbacteria bacterium]
NNYRVHVWDATGRPVRGWPRKLDNHGRAGYCSPVLVDLTRDGRPEVLIATDLGFEGPARLYALDARGLAARGWPVDLPAPCNAPAAVGDLDGDGRPEVAAATLGEGGRILLWDHRGRARPGFPVSLAGMTVNAGPLLADADGDGRCDLIVGASGTGFEPTAILLAVTCDGGETIPPFPIRQEGSEIVTGGPCVADVDDDGLLELVAGTEVHGRILVYDLEGRAGGSGMLWPRDGFDSGNTGRYDPAALDRDSAPAPAADQPAVQGPPPDNPFSPLLSVSFVLIEEGPVRLEVLDVEGKRIRTLLDTRLPTGSYTISWDGRGDQGRPKPPGIYFYQLDAPGRRLTGQLLLLQ